MLPTNLAANIGLAQLNRIDTLQARRKEIWDTYQNEFSEVPEIITPINSTENNRHTYFTYCIRIPKRDELAHYLLEKEIYTTSRYHPLHMNTLYGQTKVYLKNSEQLNKEALSIPIHPRMSNEDVMKVVKSIKEFYKK